MSGHADGGARRRQVLEAIYRSPAPLGASEIAGQVGIHPNTARYQVLAEILLGYFTGTASGHAAADAGHAWGEHVIGRAAPFQQVSQAEAVSRVLLLLDELAFAPETLAGGDDLPAEVRLRHCPFLELAEHHRDIICPLHLGLIQGAFAGLASPVTATELIPFAEPDACVVHLAAAP